MFQNLTTRLCLLLASTLLYACGNKGDLYLELDEQVVETIGQIDENDGKPDELQSNDADTEDSEGDDEKKNRDRNRPESDS